MALFENPKDLFTSNSIAWTTLFPMQDVHPSDCLGIVDLAEIDLGSLQILVPQNNFRYDFQGHTVSAGVSGRVSPEIMGRNTDIHFLAQSSYKSPCC
jgi:hypothetical protein